jgi:hypothetical protein
MHVVPDRLHAPSAVSKRSIMEIGIVTFTTPGSDKVILNFDVMIGFGAPRDQAWDTLMSLNIVTCELVFAGRRIQFDARRGEGVQAAAEALKALAPILARLEPSEPSERPLALARSTS